MQCGKCKQRNIGETKRSVAKRLLEHRGFITSMFKTKATGKGKIKSLIHYTNELAECLRLCYQSI